ncbi:MAG: hypothetical protein ABIF19_00655, partial [Planctomycetota bacterium]
MKNIVLLGIAFLLGVAVQVQSQDIPWRQIGKVRPRHAKEIQSSNWSVGAETMDRDYTIYAEWKDYLGPLGVKKARLQAGWAKTEKAEGTYGFAWLDEIVFDMHAHGVEPWICLCYGNSLYSDGGGERLGAAIPKGQKSLRAWTLWVRAVVCRYVEVVDEWEIWNEPNLRSTSAARDYAQFMLHTAEQIRMLQPRARILAMSTAGVDVKFVTDVLEIAREEGKLALIDQVTYHPYNHNPDKSYEAVEQLRRAVKQFSPRIKIRQGENGCPSMRRKTKALRDYDWTELSQSKWALRRLLGDLGRDIESSYFSIMDMKYPDEMNAKGLLKSREDQTVEYAKPAYYAVRNIAGIFDDNLVRVESFDYKADTERSLSVFAYKNRKSGLNLITVWFDAETPSDDNTASPVDLVFRDVRFEKPVYVDLRTGMVYEIPEEVHSQVDEVHVFKGVPCYDSPTLIAD